MLILNPFTSQTYIYSQDAFSEAGYYEAMARQAAQEYATAHARVRAIQHQRESQAVAYHRRQAQAAFCDFSHDVHPGHNSHRRRNPTRSPTSYSFEDIALGVWREEEHRRNLLARQREAQRQRALAEAAARQEAERRTRVLQAQRLQEQQRREAERQARAREAHRVQEREAFLAFLGLVTQFATEMETPQPAQASAVRPQTVPVSTPAPSSAPVDRKGKGKAVEVPPEAIPSSASTSVASAQPVPTLKEEIEARIHNETDPDVQESLVMLYSDLFDAHQPAHTQPVAGPSATPERSHFRVPVGESAPSTSSSTPSHPSEVEPTTQVPPETRSSTEGTHLHRTPALPPSVAAKLLKFYRARRARKLSLDEIKEVEAALRKLEEAFEFPEHLDFVNPIPSDAASIDIDSDEPGRLAYTSNNTPLHAYEHALNALLTRLDAVESNGDLEVRGRRKEVVREVERALEVIERRVEESRERERERSRERRASSALSLEVVSAPADSAEVEVKVDDTLVAPHTPEATPVVEDAPSVPVATEESSEDVSPHVADSGIDVAGPAPVEGEVDSGFVSDAPLDSSASGTSSPVATVDKAVATAEEVASSTETASLSNDTEPAPDALPPMETASSPDVVAEAVLVEDANQDTSTQVPSEPSSSEYISPPISSVTPDTPAPQAISRVSSSATDTSDATFVTVDTEVPLTSMPQNVESPVTQAPEAISRVASTATDTTDATFVTADTEVPPSSALDDETSFVSAETGPSSPSVPEPVSEPMTRTVSSASSSAGGDTFLLSSTPLADEPKRRSSNASDELEIISKEELEVARNDSDWSDLESDSDA